MIGGGAVDVEDAHVEEVAVQDAQAGTRRFREIVCRSIADLVGVAGLEVVDGEVTVHLNAVDPGVEVGIGGGHGLLRITGRSLEQAVQQFWEHISPRENVSFHICQS